MDAVFLLDTDADGTPDVRDIDSDADGILDVDDNNPKTNNPSSVSMDDTTVVEGNLSMCH